MKQYDYLIVGAGLFGSVFAQKMTESGKRCLVLEKRNHIAGNIYSETRSGIEVHVYGPHIFHTDNEDVWEYMNRFSSFNHFRYEPLAKSGGKLYHLPFNMNTFHEMWGVETPKEAACILEKQRGEITGTPLNLEEKAISLVGRDIYEALIRGYTEKQWGRPCKELPPDIISRLPVRMVYDNNYFSHPHQGIPKDGYTELVRRMLSGVEVRLNTDFLDDREKYRALADTVLFTGPIDRYFDYSLGKLEYRSLRFETRELPFPDFQGTAGVNYTDNAVPYTRIIEHKHFTFGKGPTTIITEEYPLEWTPEKEPYYPIGDQKNLELYRRYRELAEKEAGLLFGGRLGEYKYYDMDKTVAGALALAERCMRK